MAQPGPSACCGRLSSISTQPSFSLTQMCICGASAPGSSRLARDTPSRAGGFFGSANIDTRSMRLNFEFNVESYDPDLAAVVSRHIDGKLEGARRVTLKEVDGRSLPVKLRDGISRLFSPYL